MKENGYCLFLALRVIQDLFEKFKNFTRILRKSCTILREVLRLLENFSRL